jgi:DNA-binding response OmpR family regulator
MKKKILILDDRPSIGKVIALYLSGEYDFQYFDNPINGIKWMQEGNMPDLIISDIYMPEMKGTDFFQFIKNNQLFRNIPVIFLSGEENSSIRVKLLEEGAEDFILKPFNPLELKVRIKKVLK